VSEKDSSSRERMPGDAEAAGAVEAMHEERAGWRAGDLLAFILPARGITEPTAARVIRALADGLLIVEVGGDGGAMYVIEPARVVERLA
jgi:hypothetical protein